MVTVHGRTRCQFYDGTADWALRPPGQGGGDAPGDRQRRHHHRSTTRPRARAVRRRRRDDRPRRLRPARGSCARSSHSCAPASACPTRRSPSSRHRARALRRDARALRHRRRRAHRAQASRLVLEGPAGVRRVPRRGQSRWPIRRACATCWPRVLPARRSSGRRPEACCAPPSSATARDRLTPLPTAILDALSAADRRARRRRPRALRQPGGRAVLRLGRAA